ncbi:MAG: hypothetical protein ACR5KW_02840 [Wolbachia sp.]
MRLCNTLKILNEHNVKHVVNANISEINLIPSFNKNKEAKELATKFTESFNVKLANYLDSMKKSTDLDIKTFDLNFKLKNILNEYKSKDLNYQDACISDIADQFRKFKKNKNTLKMIFKGKFNAHHNHVCGKEVLKNYFFQLNYETSQ